MIINPRNGGAIAKSKGIISDETISIPAMGAIGNELMIYAVIYVSIPAMGGNRLRHMIFHITIGINPRDGGQ